MGKSDLVEKKNYASGLVCSAIQYKLLLCFPCVGQYLCNAALVVVKSSPTVTLWCHGKVFFFSIALLASTVPL